MSEEQTGGTIWKFPVPLQAEPHVIYVPRSQTIDPISLQMQEFSHTGAIPTVWAIVHLEQVDKSWQEKYGARRLWQWFGTGHPIAEPLNSNQCIGTMQFGSFVFHLFDVGRAVAHG